MILSSIFGFPIISNDYLTVIEQRETACVRSFRERLFTRPWRPMKGVAVTVTRREVPDPNVYFVNNRILAHPEVVAAITNLAQETVVGTDFARAGADRTVIHVMPPQKPLWEFRDFPKFEDIYKQIADDITRSFRISEDLFRPSIRNLPRFHEPIV